MNEESNVISCSDMINRVFTNLETSDFDRSNKIVKVWRDVVSKITGNGEKLAAHTSVVDIKNGVLLVESDHPGWNQMLQMHRKFILKGLDMYAKELGIKTLAFRIRGSAVSLSTLEDQNQIQRDKFLKKTEEEERKLEELGFSNKKQEKHSEIPDELKNLFDELKNSMLTNSQE